jgi:hypothetical protein
MAESLDQFGDELFYLHFLRVLLTAEQVVDNPSQFFPVYGLFLFRFFLGAFHRVSCNEKKEMQVVVDQTASNLSVTSL